MRYYIMNVPSSNENATLSHILINFLHENVTFNPQIVNKILNSTLLETLCHCKLSKKEKYRCVRPNL